MKAVLLDSNFMIYCLDKKIDFFEYFKLNGFSVFIPKEVLNEIERLSKSSKFKQKFINLKKLLEIEKWNLVEIGGRYADSEIRKYLKENPKTVLASMDEKLVKSVNNKSIQIKGNQLIENYPK